MTAHLPPDSTEAVPMILVAVPDGSGGTRHEWRPAPPEKPKARKKQRHAPDPIEANPESAAQQLKLFIERLERLEEEKQGIADDIRDVKAEAKAVGFDVKAMSAIVALRKLHPDIRQEAEAILETYKCSLGIV